MKITIFRIMANGSEKVWRTFENSVDAREEMAILDKTGFEYRVEWDCRDCK